MNPREEDVDVQLDCGDVPVSPFDSAIAIKQIKAAYSSMLNHPVANPGKMAELGMAKGLDGEYHPRVIALGGDHTIVRPLPSPLPINTADK
jgi:agmatinase